MANVVNENANQVMTAEGNTLTRSEVSATPAALDSDTTIDAPGVGVSITTAAVDCDTTIDAPGAQLEAVTPDLNSETTIERPGVRFT